MFCICLLLVTGSLLDTTIRVRATGACYGIYLITCLLSLLSTYNLIDVVFKTTPCVYGVVYCLSLNSEPRIYSTTIKKLEEICHTNALPCFIRLPRQLL